MLEELLSDIQSFNLMALTFIEDVNSYNSNRCDSVVNEIMAFFPLPKVSGESKEKPL